MASPARDLVARARRELGRRTQGAWARVLPAGAAGVPDGAWLLGGSVGAHYGDNSAALHEHLVRHHPAVPAYWVIQRQSPDVAKARAVGPVLFLDDPRTFAAVQRASVCVISHGVHDLPGLERTRALKVRLGHGLTALKGTKASGLRSVQGQSALFDVVPVASAFEADNKHSWGIARDALAITGLPRFDTLVRRAQRASSTPRTLLYMPTWREWIKPTAGALAGTAFFDNVSAFLASPTLHAALAAHDATLEVYVHRLMHAHVPALTASAHGRVRVLPASADVQEALARARALVTDYSSVCWDMVYLRRPVLFFAFDIDEALTHRAAYLDLRRELPGRLAQTPDAAAAAVATLLERDCAVEEGDPQRAWYRRAFAFDDDGNCARVVAAIEERLATRATRRRP